MIPLVSIRAMGLECVPWSPPHIGNKRRKDGTRFKFTTQKKPDANDIANGRVGFEGWQDYIRSCAQRRMESLALKPTHEQVKIRFQFFAKTPTGHRHGELWPIAMVWDKKKKNAEGQVVGGWTKKSRDGRLDGDVTNILKAAEDALQDVVILNDCQCRIQETITLFGPMSGVIIDVWIIEPSDFPGEGEIVG